VTYLRSHMALVLGASLSERKRDDADDRQQKQVKRTSNKMRSRGWINSLFHKSDLRVAQCVSSSSAKVMGEVAAWDAASA
jgi:hypothetical protein